MSTMRKYNLWAVIRPAEDIQHQWVAHCLDLDVVTQGDSFKHAMDMLFEATSMVVAEDIVVGKDPLSRRAPDDQWKELFDFVEHGEPVRMQALLGGVERDFVKAVALQMVLTVELAACELLPKVDVPLLWQGSPTAHEQRA